VLGGMAGSPVRQGSATTVQRVSVGLRGNRGTLRLLLGLTLVMTLAFGAVATEAIASRSSATTQFAARSESLAIDLQQLYTVLDDADATAAAAYLSGPVIAPALRDEYDADIARAESSLSAASRDVAGDDAASARLAVIATQIPVYTGLVATAQTDNRQSTSPQPIGTAYLGEASTLMRTTLLPDTLSAYRSEVAATGAAKASATGVPWSLAVWLVLALAVLITAQWQITRRTRRIINPGLLTATGLLVAAAVWTGVSIGAHRSHLDDALGQATRIQTLATAADAAIQAHADEALMLIAHGSDNGSHAQDFTAQMKTATATLGTGTTAPRLADAAGRLRDWSTVDGQVRSSTAAGDYQGAVAAAIGSGSADAARIGADLDAEMTSAQRVFVDDANAGASALGGLAAGEIVLAVLAAVAAGYGVSRRLAEYR
jgi:hypothetical protein